MLFYVLKVLFSFFENINLMCCCFSYIRRLRFHRADRIVDELVMSCCWCWAGTHRALCSYGRASSHAAALTYNSSWKLCFIFGLSQFQFLNFQFSLIWYFHFSHFTHTEGALSIDKVNVWLWDEIGFLKRNVQLSAIGKTSSLTSFLHNHPENER